MKRPRKPRYIRVTVGLSKTDYRFVRDVSEEAEVSVGWVVREAVRQWKERKELKS